MSAAAKRGRGRPKKTDTKLDTKEEDNVVEDNANGNGSVEVEEVTKKESPKKRGRPTTKAPAANGTSNGSTAANGSNGTTEEVHDEAENGNNDVVEEVEEAVTEPKRGRGRAPAAKKPAAEEEGEEEEEKKENGAAPKRGRGRPPKKGGKAAPKKAPTGGKRGRPKKVVEAPSEESEDVENGAAEEIETVE